MMVRQCPNTTPYVFVPLTIVLIEESKSFEFDGRLDVLVVAEVL